MNRLDKYFQLSLQQIAHTASLTEVEPLFVEVLEFIEHHPEQRKEFEHQFSLALHEGIAPWELIQFCMRSLQWEAVRNTAFAIYRTASDFRIKSIMKDIMAVYEPIWEDEDLYRYFRKSK